MADFDDAGSIGKRYRRQDEIGTPYCVTFDFDSLQDGCVTVRDRDSMAQERILIDRLVGYITEKSNGKNNAHQVRRPEGASRSKQGPVNSGASSAEHRDWSGFAHAGRFGFRLADVLFLSCVSSGCALKPASARAHDAADLFCFRQGLDRLYCSGAPPVFDDDHQLLKMQIRAEPLVFSDLYLVGEAGDSVSGYDLILNWKIWVAAGYAVLGTAAALFLCRHRPAAGTRLLGSASVILACAVLYNALYTNDKVYGAAKSGYEVNAWSFSEQYIVRGFVYPFIYSIRQQSTKVPPGYNKDQAAAALSAYSSDAIPDGRKVNIVAVMLESYADLSDLGTIELSRDVYGPLHALQKESVCGRLIVNTFAGGTIDSERSFLTGFTKLGNFQAPTNSYVRYFKDQGYYTEGYHAGDSWYYNRKTVNAKLGFDNYYYLEDFQGSTRWDESFFATVLRLYASRDPDVPYFSYSLSYQNHGPYDNESKCETAYVKKDGLTDSSYNILNNYLEGVSDTTRRISEFVDYFRRRSEPVVVVLFGDHRPWLGNNYEVYAELGVATGKFTEQGFYDFYSTPYLIWANDAAKDALGSDFKGDGGDFSPCFLMNKLFEVCKWGGNSYMKAANELKRHADIVSTATGCMFEIDGITSPLSAEAMAVYADFQKIEYYWQRHLLN